MTREQMIDEAVRRVLRDWVGPHTQDIEDHFFDPSNGKILRAGIRAEFRRLVAGTLCLVSDGPMQKHGHQSWGGNWMN